MPAEVMMSPTSSITSNIYITSHPEAQVSTVNTSLLFLHTKMSSTFKVGVILGSQRTPRVGDQITDFVLQTLENATSHRRSDITFQLIDIGAVNLPFYDEPGIPQKILSPDGYAHEHTRAWARTISALDAFVFVTPQYNWGIPAGLKNAIDYLFNEWKGKPAMIISYGGHGGDKCAAALKVVLGGGIDMQVVEPVCLPFPSRDFLVKSTRGEPLGLNAGDDSGAWAKERGDLVATWEEVLKLLEL